MTGRMKWYNRHIINVEEIKNNLTKKEHKISICSSCGEGSDKDLFLCIKFQDGILKKR